MNMGALVSHTTFSPNPTRMLLPATICLNELSLPLTSLVDSGAEENFLDSDLAQQAGLELGSLETPLSANALDGRLISKVTHCTQPLKLLLSGNHQEILKFNIISSPHSPLILGYPWLRTHNPNFDWAKLQSRSNYCHSTCLKSALPPTSSSLPEPSEPPDLTNVPNDYQDLTNVFSKDCALSLPPHRPYDCAIDLLPGASLPSSRLYNL